MLIGILATTAVGLATGIAKWTPAGLQPGRTLRHGLQARHRAPRCASASSRSSSCSCSSICSTTSGRWWRSARRPNLFDEANQIPRINRILFSDAIATIVGSLTGTSTVVSYIESAAGVAAGGRTGVTAIVTGLLFVLALFVAPVVGAIPAAATAPALIIVGSMMVVAWSARSTGTIRKSRFPHFSR